MRFYYSNLITGVIIICILGACKHFESSKEIDSKQDVATGSLEDSEIEMFSEDFVIDIRTTYVKEITSNTAVIGGKVHTGDLEKILFMGVVWADFTDPTVERNLGYTAYPRGGQEIESKITGLKPGVEYYARTYVTTNHGTFYGNKTFFQTPAEIVLIDSVKDFEGNEYPVVVIGKQKWMAANLRTSLFANGDPIPADLSDYVWSYSMSGAYDVYPYEMAEGINSREKMLETYGALYNWRAVSDTRGICPAGWRIPTHDDFVILEQFIEGSNTETSSFPFNGLTVGFLGSMEGNKLKSVNQTKPGAGDDVGKIHPFWDFSGNFIGTDDFGFHAVPAGRRSFTGGFERLGQSTYFWSSSLKQSDYAWYRTLESDRSQIGRQGALLRWGFSVRCVQDVEY